MRRALVLILLALSLGCRRSPPPPPAVAAGIAPSTAQVPPATTTPEAPPSPASPAPKQPSPARETIEPARAAPAATAATTASPEPAPAADEPEDDRIYSWTDERGTVHFGTAAEAPSDGRRAVESGVTIVPVRSYDASTTPSASPGTSADVEPEQEPPARGPRPQLDAQGLPIPGTMDDTAHTRTLRQATGVQLDPASMERQRAVDNQRMNCVQKDGGTFCSGE